MDLVKKNVFSAASCQVRIRRVFFFLLILHRVFKWNNNSGNRKHKTRQRELELVHQQIEDVRNDFITCPLLWEGKMYHIINL